MKKSKPTPGEWSADHCNVLGKRWIAECYGDTTEEAEANAQLIASAPDLLEACKDMVNYFRKEHYFANVPLFKAQQAINKAEGGEQ